MENPTFVSFYGKSPYHFVQQMNYSKMGNEKRGAYVPFFPFFFSTKKQKYILL
jgi:chlorite dismutase